MTKIIIEQNLGGKIKAKNQNNGLKFKITQLSHIKPNCFLV